MKKNRSKFLSISLSRKRNVQRSNDSLLPKYRVHLILVFSKRFVFFSCTSRPFHENSPVQFSYLIMVHKRTFITIGTQPVQVNRFVLQLMGHIHVSLINAQGIHIQSTEIIRARRFERHPRLGHWKSTDQLVIHQYYWYECLPVESQPTDNLPETNGDSFSLKKMLASKVVTTCESVEHVVRRCVHSLNRVVSNTSLSNLQGRPLISRQEKSPISGNQGLR